MQEIPIGDTVTVLSGNRKGETGVVLRGRRAQRSHYILRCHTVQFPDGSEEDFESIEVRPTRGDDKPRKETTKEAKPLDLEKVLEAKPAEEKAPVKPPEAKPKEETRHAREA